MVHNGESREFPGLNYLLGEIVGCGMSGSAAVFIGMSVCYCCKCDFVSPVSLSIILHLSNVCFFSFSLFHKVASLLGLCLFWQPAT